MIGEGKSQLEPILNRDLKIIFKGAVYCGNDFLKEYGILSKNHAVQGRGKL
jgi:hypothetical protein